METATIRSLEPYRPAQTNFVSLSIGGQMTLMQTQISVKRMAKTSRQFFHGVCNVPINLSDLFVKHCWTVTEKMLDLSTADIKACLHVLVSRGPTSRVHDAHCSFYSIHVYVSCPQDADHIGFLLTSNKKRILNYLMVFTDDSF